MTTTPPQITIFVRHSDGCKYAGDEQHKKCNCRKHLRWFANGKQQTKTAKTRTWTNAETAKRDLEDQLAGRVQVTVAPVVRYLAEAIEIFIKDKTVQGVSRDVLNKYVRLLSRLRTYCEAEGVHTVQGITRELLTGFLSTWPTLYPSSLTRSKQRERLGGFLRYGFQAQWLPRVPTLPKIKTDDAIETQPLEPEEYKRLLDAVFVTVGYGDAKRQKTSNGGGRWQYPDAKKWQHAVHTFFQTMRWSGLAIGDTLTLPRKALTADAAGLYRIKTKRRKTGKPIDNAIPEQVALDLIAVQNDNPLYFFWSGNGDPKSAISNWGQRFIAPCFKAAGIVCEGNMVSHRLRDTFAVRLLENGVPMGDVAKALGDSLRVTEKHYAKHSKARQARLDTLLVGAFDAAPKKGTRRGRKAQRDTAKRGAGVAA